MRGSETRTKVPKALGGVQGFARGGSVRRAPGGPVGQVYGAALPSGVKSDIENTAAQDAGFQSADEAGSRIPFSLARGGHVDKWIQRAVPASHKGRLHRALGVPESEKIPEEKLQKAAHSSSPHMRHMARFAENVKK